MEHHVPNDVTFRIDVDITMKPLAETNDDSETTDATSMSVAVDATLTSHTDGLARDVLVRSVPQIAKAIKHFQGIVWSIQEKPSVDTMAERWQPKAVADVQTEHDMRLSSIEETMLSQHTKKGRMRIVTEGKLELWQFMNPHWNLPVRCLYVDGQLQSTSAAEGIARAEAMVHPAMIAHSEKPERIVVISVEPTMLVREILKHESVKEVVVVGADPSAVALVDRFMGPVFDDCSFLPESQTRQEKKRLDQQPHYSCMNSSKVRIVRGPDTVEEWLESVAVTLRTSEAAEDEENDKDDGSFDAVFVEVPKGTKPWLELDLYAKLSTILDPEAVVVVNSGSTPLLSDRHRETILSPRDLLLRQAHRSTEHGGLGYGGVLVYDEAQAMPLSSSFIVMFPTDSYTFARFLRRNTPAVEVDIIDRVLPIPGRPSSLAMYDGMAHLGYVATHRMWQEWYCNSIPGRDLPACSSFLSEWYDRTKHSYDADVQRDAVKGRALHATKDIPKGSFILPHDAAMSARLDAQQWEALTEFVEDFPDASMYKDFRDFFLAYGYEAEEIGQTGWTVSIACKNTFTNHACTDEEANAGYIGEIFENEDGGSIGFNPVITRKADIVGTLTVALQDIPAGTEIQTDYSSFRTYEDEDFTNFLNKVCTTGVGKVSVDANTADQSEEL